jgi:uncharacterized protein YciI
MPFYSIIARDKPNGLDHRMAVRPEHLKHLDSLGDKLLLAGPFQTEEATATGSFMVIEAPDLKSATAMFEQDPFIRYGVFESWEISRWALTINKTAGR